MAVGAILHTTHWGLLKQPDKHKLVSPFLMSLAPRRVPTRQVLSVCAIALLGHTQSNNRPPCWDPFCQAIFGRANACVKSGFGLQISVLVLLVLSAHPSTGRGLFRIHFVIDTVRMKTYNQQ